MVLESLYQSSAVVLAIVVSVECIIIYLMKDYIKAMLKETKAVKFGMKETTDQLELTNVSLELLTKQLDTIVQTTNKHLETLSNLLEGVVKIIGAVAEPIFSLEKHALTISGATSTVSKVAEQAQKQLGSPMGQVMSIVQQVANYKMGGGVAAVAGEAVAAPSTGIMGSITSGVINMVKKAAQRCGNRWCREEGHTKPTCPHLQPDDWDGKSTFASRNKNGAQAQTEAPAVAVSG